MKTMTAKTEHSAAVKAFTAFVAGLPDATVFRNSQNVAMYKVRGKIFAILSMKTGYVVLKCDPDSIEMLKAQYKGIGHKTHLDHRRWIAVELNSDVPLKEAKRLASLSYDLVRTSDESKPRRAPKKLVRRKTA